MIRSLRSGGGGVRRTSACLLAAGALLAAVNAPMAPALARQRGLHEEQHRVQHLFSKTVSNLDDVSRRLAATAAALRRVRAKQAAASDDLAQAQAELAAAEAVDAKTQAELADAKRRLRDARGALELGARRVAGQRARVAALAVEEFQDHDQQLMDLSVLLNTGSPQQLSNRLAAVDVLVDQGSESLDGLRAARILLAVQKREVAESERLVARRRAAAARNLVRTRAAKDRAAAAEQAVAQMVKSRKTARSAAQQAVRHEKSRLAALRDERGDIEHMLAVRAQRQLARHAGVIYAGPSNGYLAFPVSRPVTSPYGMRMHPILHIMELHDGTDFGAACGAPVRAAADGVVLSSYFDSGYGNRLIVADGFVHGISLSTAYNHLRASTVGIGEHVKRGEIIGYIGSTGYATGCHLHFMVYVNGGTVDPMRWL